MISNRDVLMKSPLAYAVELLMHKKKNISSSAGKLYSWGRLKMMGVNPNLFPSCIGIILFFLLRRHYKIS